MTHLDEDEFRDRVAEWYRRYSGAISVETEVYQPEPYTFADIVVVRSDLTCYIEVENDADSVADAPGQAAQYAGGDIVRGVPMVVVPAGHVDQPEVDRIRVQSSVLIREFDADEMTWV